MRIAQIRGILSRLFIVCSALSTGCGTAANFTGKYALQPISPAHALPPRPFGGAALDFWLAVGAANWEGDTDESPNDRLLRYALTPMYIALATADFPLSFAGDIVTLPVVAWMTLKADSGEVHATESKPHDDAESSTLR